MNVVLSIVCHLEFSVDTVPQKLGMFLPSGIRVKGLTQLGALQGSDISNCMRLSFSNGHTCLEIFLLYT
jgi:hypothetical protein